MRIRHTRRDVSVGVGVGVSVNVGVVTDVLNIKACTKKEEAMSIE